MCFIYSINEELKQIHRFLPLYLPNDLCPRARARACAIADPCRDANVFDFIVCCSFKPCLRQQLSQGVGKRGAKWQVRVWKEKCKQKSMFSMIAMVVQMIKLKIAKVSRPQRSMLRFNSLALRNARLSLHNILHSTTLSVDAIS